MNFIPSFHFMPSADKLKSKFCEEVIGWYWHNTNLHGLLDGKNVKEIVEYATGDIDLIPFMSMTKSLKKDMKAKFPGGLKGQDEVQLMQYIRYAPLPVKINSATAIMQKNPIEVTCTALDSLAEQKKNEDITFLENKSTIEADLQPLADQMQLGKVDLGTTKHSSEPYSDNPYGLDLNEPDEKSLFVNLIYKLGVEQALEVALQKFSELKNLKQTRRLETKDQLYYGVSVNHTFQSSTTGLMDFKYVYPGNVKIPYSDLPDYGDREVTFVCEKVTPLELMNYFGNEICNEDDLYDIVNGGDKFGYCSCNQIDTQLRGNFNTFKMDLIYCEVKSIDGVGIVSNSKKSPYSFMQPLTGDKEQDDKCTDQVWGQNTYGFWWLQNTKHFFGIHKLGYATRTKGQESYQNFSYNIYKSQELSAVELSIDENKKAQIASIRMMYALIMSLPAGKYIDLNFLQQASLDLKESFGENVVEQLIDLAFEKNIFIGSSAGFDDKPNMGNFRPFVDIPGGMKTEINGYIQTIAHADAKISQFTGANDYLTGQSSEDLVGLQKYRIDSGINALFYIFEALEAQYQKPFQAWAWDIKDIIEKGGKPKKTLSNMIGSANVNVIDRLDELAMHSMYVKVVVASREQERQDLKEQVNRLIMQGVLDASDIYMLSSIENIKEKFKFIAIKEQKFRRRYDAEQQQRIAARQQEVEQQGQNIIAAQQAKTEGNIKEIYASGDVEAKITQLANSLGLNALQLEGLIKKQLQSDRNNAQVSKSIQTLQAKANLDNQKSFAT